ncbi:hypothetical protein KZ548_000380 [Escherichia coli]|nr:hypothetical protein [Escherichia coli]
MVQTGTARTTHSIKLWCRVPPGAWRRLHSRDPFWCRNVLSPSKLREKWDELSLRLSPSVSTYTEKREDPYFKASYDNVDYSQIPAGLRKSSKRAVSGDEWYLSGNYVGA